MNIEEGKDLYLEIELSSKEKVDLVWQLGSEELEETANVKFGFKNKKYFIEFSDIQKEYSGKLEAIVKENKEIKSSCFINVQEKSKKPPLTKPKSKKIQLQIKDEPSLTDKLANFRGNLKKVALPSETKEEQEVKIQKPAYQNKLQRFSPGEDFGEDSDGRIKFIERLKPCVAMCENPATFSIKLNKEIDAFKWLINTEEIDMENPSYKFENKENSFSMTILQCCMNHNKKIIKFIANENEDLSCVAKLTVQPIAPSVFKKDDSINIYHTGDNITLAIEIKGHTDPTIEWYKGMRKLTDNKNKTSITKEGAESVLTILRASTSDSGVYKAIVKSKDGTSDVKFNVEVKG